MPLRVAMLAAECEPWAKVGGLGDMVDALARAVGGSATARRTRRWSRRSRCSSPLSGGAGSAAGSVRSVREVRVPDPRAPAGSSTVSVLDVAANGYLLRLVDHPAAFDRAGIYGDAAGEYADNAWRYRLVLPGRARDPADGPGAGRRAAPPRLARRTRRSSIATPGMPTTLPSRARLCSRRVHNLAYRGWTPRSRLGQLGLAPGDGIVGSDDGGIDLLATGIARSELVNTVSPGFARRGVDAGSSGSVSMGCCARRAIGSSAS